MTEKIVLALLAILMVVIMIGGMAFAVRYERASERLVGHRLVRWERDLVAFEGPSVKMEHNRLCRWIAAETGGAYDAPATLDRARAVAIDQGAADPDLALARWCMSRGTPELKYPSETETE